MRTYLLSSFPSLSLDAPSPISFGEFMRECSTHLSPSDLEELDAVCASPPSGKSAFAKEWSKLQAVWHAQNQYERRQRLPQETVTSTPAEFDSDQLHDDHQLAWQASNPLAREKALQASLWNWIEIRRRQDPFSLQDLLGYALQLQILEHREIWNETEGLKQFQEHTQSFLAPVLEELRKQELSA
ncbi:hypothetical protein P0Y35_03795 [Kiritimatiellaeota bacterium B1221]|nr:hypothetical protein [Kiritimatiellaeota bacterium B1221]